LDVVAGNSSLFSVIKNAKETIFDMKFYIRPFALESIEIDLEPKISRILNQMRKKLATPYVGKRSE